MQAVWKMEYPFYGVWKTFKWDLANNLTTFHLMPFYSETVTTTTELRLGSGWVSGLGLDQGSGYGRDDDEKKNILSWNVVGWKVAHQDRGLRNCLLNVNAYQSN